MRLVWSRASVVGLERSGWAAERFRRESLQDSVIHEGRHNRVKNCAQASNLVVFLFIRSGGKRRLISLGITVQILSTLC